MKIWLFVVVVAWKGDIGHSFVHNGAHGKKAQRYYTQARPDASGVEQTALPHSTDRSEVCVLLPHPSQEPFIQIACDLSKQLQLECISLDDLDADSEYQYALVIQDDPSTSWKQANDIHYNIALQPITSTDYKRLRKRHRTRSLHGFSMTPISINFCPSVADRSSIRPGKDLLVQAVCPQKAHGNQGGATVLDLTAGFGQDALTLAHAGAGSVTMVERNVIVHALLQDAFRRLDLVASHCTSEAGKCLAQGLLQKLRLIHGDSRDVAQEMLRSSSGPECLFDVVYIDQMFPPRTKSASVKKNMQILHSLLKSQEASEARLEEESALLHSALSLAQSRVVCKRPLTAPTLGLPTDCEPSYTVRGTTSRWDVYLR